MATDHAPLDDDAGDRSSTEALLAGAEALILGDGTRYSPSEIWALAGVSQELARRLWLAMGFPHVPDDEAILTDRDLLALTRTRDLLAAGHFDEDHLVHQTRVMSQALSTIAASHVETLDLGGDHDGFLAGVIGARTDPLPFVDEMLSYLYRRHLFAALEHLALVHEPSRSSPTTVVGFADLTDFSATAARATEEELTVLVDDFAAVAADLVASAGGRVVKLIGDEVMFSVEDPKRAAVLALQLVEMVERPEMPPVHVGLALGSVLGHHGDLFGSTVNLASRLSDVARAGTVLASAELAAELTEDAGLDLRRVHLKPLKGIGPVTAYVLRRGEDGVAAARPEGRATARDHGEQ